MTTPLDDLAPLEAGFRAAFFGRFKGGIFGEVREPPPEIVALAIAGNADAILGSLWWSKIWGDPKAEELEGATGTIDRHLARPLEGAVEAVMKIARDLPAVAKQGRAPLPPRASLAPP